MTGYRPPKRTPAQTRHLERLLQSYGDANGIAPSRVRRWISMMVMIGALDRVHTDPNHPWFLVKGGVAMELRLREGARTTRDLDMIFLGEPNELLATLDIALTEPYSHFTFARGPAEPIGATTSRRLEVKLAFNSRSWATVKLEISRPEGRSGQEPEVLEAISIADFGLTGPETVGCLSIHYQIAQKLHACTEVFERGRPNDRFRDLVDLLLLRALNSDPVAIRRACTDIFNTRQKQPWPPSLITPTSWSEPYARLARELSFPVTDVKEAAGLVTGFIAEIDAAVNLSSPIAPPSRQPERR